MRYAASSAWTGRVITGSRTGRGSIATARWSARRWAPTWMSASCSPSCTTPAGRTSTKTRTTAHARPITPSGCANAASSTWTTAPWSCSATPVSGTATATRTRIRPCRPAAMPTGWIWAASGSGPTPATCAPRLRVIPPASRTRTVVRSGQDPASRTIRACPPPQRSREPGTRMRTASCASHPSSEDSSAGQPHRPVPATGRWSAPLNPGACTPALRRPGAA